MGQFSKEIPAPRGAGQSPKEDEDWDGLAAITASELFPGFFVLFFQAIGRNTVRKIFLPTFSDPFFLFFPQNPTERHYRYPDIGLSTLN